MLNGARVSSLNRKQMHFSPRQPEFSYFAALEIDKHRICVGRPTQPIARQAMPPRNCAVAKGDRPDPDDTLEMDLAVIQC